MSVFLHGLLLIPDRHMADQGKSLPLFLWMVPAEPQTHLAVSEGTSLPSPEKSEKKEWQKKRRDRSAALSPAAPLEESKKKREAPPLLRSESALPDLPQSQENLLEGEKFSGTLVDESLLRPHRYRIAANLWQQALPQRVGLSEKTTRLTFVLQYQRGILLPQILLRSDKTLLREDKEELVAWLTSAVKGTKLPEALRGKEFNLVLEIEWHADPISSRP